MDFVIIVDPAYIVTALINAYNNLGEIQEGIKNIGYLKQGKHSVLKAFQLQWCAIEIIH